MKKIVLLFICVLFILISNLPLLSQTWTLQRTQGVILYGIVFLDATTAIAVGGTGWADKVILRTTDTGSNWTAITTSASAYTFRAVFFTSTSNGYVFGEVGTIMKTTDGGTIWSFVSTGDGTNLFGGSVNGSTIIAVGSSGVIVRSGDGGAIWGNPTGTYPSSTDGNSLYGVSVSSSTNAVAVGNSGSVYKTTDAGVNWTSISSGTADPLTAVTFFNGNTGVAAGFNGTIIRTTDGGATWSAPTSKPNIGTAAWRAISFFSTTTGIVVGDAGNMAKTVDGGQNWTIMTNTFSDAVTNNNFFGVSMRDINNGFAVGGSTGKIYYTTTAALPVELTSFTAVSIGSTVSLNWQTATEVNNYGFEVERQVVSKQSAVGGWKNIGFVNGNGNSNSLKKYSFTDNEVSAGTYSYRLKQIDNDGKFEYSKEVEVEVNILPTKYALDQNFPNPFNPSTRIQYSIVSSQNVSLKVFNILGKEVAVLVNEKKEPGTYTVDFSGAYLASGTYFYRLQAGEFVQTKKMAVLK